MPQTAESLAPVEFLVLGFRGNRFDGDILPALSELLEGGFVRIIDLAVVSKDAAGNVTIIEAQELSPEVAAGLYALTGEVSGLLSEADLFEAAEDIAPDHTAVTLLIEHLWAGRFARAVRAANGELLLAERIPPAVIEETRALLASAATLVQ